MCLVFVQVCGGEERFFAVGTFEGSLTCVSPPHMVTKAFSTLEPGFTKLALLLQTVLHVNLFHVLLQRLLTQPLELFAALVAAIGSLAAMNQFSVPLPQGIAVEVYPAGHT